MRGSLSAEYLPVNMLPRLYRDHSPVDDDLVGHHNDEHIQPRQASQALSCSRLELELRPTLYVIIPIAADHSVEINEYCFHFVIPQYPEAHCQSGRSPWLACSLSLMRLYALTQALPGLVSENMCLSNE